MHGRTSITQHQSRHEYLTRNSMVGRWEEAWEAEGSLFPALDDECTLWGSVEESRVGKGGKNVERPYISFTEKPEPP